MRGGGGGFSLASFWFLHAWFLLFQTPSELLRQDQQWHRSDRSPVSALQFPYWKRILGMDWRWGWEPQERGSVPDESLHRQWGHAPGTFAPLPLGNMKPVIYSFQWLMLFHPQRRRPIITCHTSNSSPSAPELRESHLPLSTPRRQTVWQKYPEAIVCRFFLLARIYLDGGKLILGLFKGDETKEAVISRIERGTGRFRLLIPIHITRSHSCQPPPSERRIHASPSQDVFIPHVAWAHECGFYKSWDTERPVWHPGASLTWVAGKQICSWIWRLPFSF